MHITITARHFELTNAIRDYVEENLEKLTRYFDQIITVQVTLTVESSRNQCEISMQASKFSLQSAHEAMDMYLAIDEAIDKMESQIKKLKDKITEHQKKGLKEHFDPYYTRTEFYLKDKSNDHHSLVKTKRVVTDSLTVDEAIQRFEKQDNEYFIFKNVESDRINVLVKKDGSHFKLLQP